MQCHLHVINELKQSPAVFQQALLLQMAIIFFKCLFIYFERDRARASREEAEREERENPQQAPVLSATHRAQFHEL